MPPAKRQAIQTNTSYGKRSTRPLAILLFLLPLVIAYEVGLAVCFTDASGATREAIEARVVLTGFFNLFGVGALYLPGVVMVVVLLLWHIFVRDPWKVRLADLAGMLVEAAVWSLPLLVLWQVAGQAFAVLADASVPFMAEAATQDVMTGRPMTQRFTIAIGAGLYEELLFRMMGIAAVHFVLVDFLGVPETQGRIGAVVATAIAFAFFHHNPAIWFFYFVAGIYFGGLYVWRGFGIAVGAHAGYDIAVALLAG